MAQRQFRNVVGIPFALVKIMKRDVCFGVGMLGQYGWGGICRLGRLRLGGLGRHRGGWAGSACDNMLVTMRLEQYLEYLITCRHFDCRVMDPVQKLLYFITSVRDLSLDEDDYQVEPDVVLQLDLDCE